MIGPSNRERLLLGGTAILSGRICPGTSKFEEYIDMDLLSIAILVFIVMESANVAILYFWPGSRLGNGVGVFNAFSNPESEEQRLFSSYLVNWVAGVKLIFIFLLAVILAIGTEQVKLWAVVAMILSITTYFWRLHPTIKKLDAMGCITPKGYSKALGWMITGFLIMFTLALIGHILAAALGA